MLPLINRYPLPVFARTIGKVVHELRTGKKMSQEKLAEVIDSHQVYISEIERGLKIPSLPILYSLAKAFGLTLSEFISIIEGLLQENS